VVLLCTDARVGQKREQEIEGWGGLWGSWNKRSAVVRYIERERDKKGYRVRKNAARRIQGETSSNDKISLRLLGVIVG